MAIQPKCACQVIRARATYTTKQGRFLTPATTAATQNLDFVGPMQMAGADATPFSIPLVNGQGTVTVPFYNLPAWTRGGVKTVPNYLQPYRNQPRVKATFVRDMNQFFFAVHSMNVQAPPGVRVDVSPRAIDHTGVAVTGPFIGGGRAFREYQCVVTATAGHNVNGTVSGTAVAHLHHVFG